MVVCFERKVPLSLWLVPVCFERKDDVTFVPGVHLLQTSRYKM
jgi:hypothetical protein